MGEPLQAHSLTSSLKNCHCRGTPAADLSAATTLNDGSLEGLVSRARVDLGVGQRLHGVAVAVDRPELVRLPDTEHRRGQQDRIAISPEDASALRHSKSGQLGQTIGGRKVKV